MTRDTQMHSNAFSETIGSTQYTFQKLLAKNNNLLFLVHIPEQDNTSFMMYKDANGKWQIMYNNVIGLEFMKVEPHLQQFLHASGY